MAAQRFLNNFDWTFLGPVTAATHVGFESTIGRGILQISDAAGALLLNPTGGDWYVLTGYKRAGSVESAIEIIKVLGVNEVAYAAPGECRIRVERGHEGSMLQTYVAGDLISMRITAGGLNDLASDAELTAHTGNTSNPHTVTKAQVGLGNADNTSDANKPVSTAQAAADTAATNAAKAYADGLVVGLWDDRGAYNASVNTFPAAGGSGTAGAVLKGDIWIVSVAGTLGGVAVAVGDSVRALVDTPAQTAANWALLENNIGYVPENAASKDASGGYAGLTLFKLNLRNAANTFTSFLTNAATAARTWAMQDRDGTVALTDDITGGTLAGSFTTLTASGLIKASEATTAILMNYTTGANSRSAMQIQGTNGSSVVKTFYFGTNVFSTGGNLELRSESGQGLVIKHATNEVAFDGAVTIPGTLGVTGAITATAGIAVEAVLTPTMTNGWGAGVKYWKDSFGVVHLQGSMAAGTAGGAFTLPAGYRPAVANYFPCGTGAASSVSRLDISIAGVVEPWTLATTNLDGITFRTT